MGCEGLGEQGVLGVPTGQGHHWPASSPNPLAAPGVWAGPLLALAAELSRLPRDAVAPAALGGHSWAFIEGLLGPGVGAVSLVVRMGLFSTAIASCIHSEHTVST